MMKYCFGVDVGGTTVKLGLFTVEGELLDYGRLRLTQKTKENVFCQMLQRQLREKLLKNFLKPKKSVALE